MLAARECDVCGGIGVLVAEDSTQLWSWAYVTVEFCYRTARVTRLIADVPARIVGSCAYGVFASSCEAPDLRMQFVRIRTIFLDEDSPRLR